MTDVTARSHGFKVTRQMPAEGQDYQFRVKDNRDGCELVVRESELS